MSSETHFSEGDKGLLRGPSSLCIHSLSSLFSKTKSVHHHLSDAEVLSILDAHVQVTKKINNMSPIMLRNRVELMKNFAPLKTLQEATRILFGWSRPVERSNTIPIYDVNCLGLKLEGLDYIYEKLTN